MCRHLAWLGEPRTLASLVLEGEQSLLVQSYRPRRQRHGTVNADGWGVGFYAGADQRDQRDEPARWRSDRPLWSDASFASLAPVISSGCVLAAVRSATVGMPVDEASTAPFQSGRWLLSHNGIVDRAVLGPQLRAESVCDSVMLAAHVFEHGADQLGALVREVGGRDPGARLNLLATDGSRLLATTWGDTLSVLQTEDGVLISSEPIDDDPRWSDVPDRHLVDVTAGHLTITSLED